MELERCLRGLSRKLVPLKALHYIPFRICESDEEVHGLDRLLTTRSLPFLEDMMTYLPVFIIIIIIH